MEMADNTLIIKLGGALLESDEALGALFDGLTQFLEQQHRPLVLVHGGGCLVADAGLKVGVVGWSQGVLAGWYRLCIVLVRKTGDAPCYWALAAVGLAAKKHSNLMINKKNALLSAGSPISSCPHKGHPGRSFRGA